MPAAKQPIGFDAARLAKLTEPVTVTVRKEVAGQKMPIVLPTKPGENVGGKGWTKDETSQLDQFISKKWCGGGKYFYQVLGANGEQMKWESYFPEQDYPELVEGVPKQLPVAAPPPPPISQFGGAPVPGLTGMPQQPHWLSQALPPQMPAAPRMPAAPSPWMSPYQAQYGTPLGFQGYQPQPPPATMQAQTDRDTVHKLEARIERQNLENGYKEQMGSLTGELRQLQQAVVSKPQQSDEVKLLKEQLSRMELSKSEDKFAAAIAESARQSREMIQQMQTDNNRRFTELQTLLAAQPKGPDPTLMLIMETQKTAAAAQMDAQRLQVEAQKEATRLQIEAQKDVSRNQIGPAELVDILGRFNTGAESQVDVMSKSWEMMMHAVDTMMSSQGPAPHPALDLLGQAAQGGLQLAGRFVEAKEQTALAGAHVAQAQAQAMQQQAMMAQQRAPQQIPSAAAAGVTEDEPMPNSVAKPVEEVEGEVVDIKNGEPIVEEEGNLSPEDLAKAEAEMFGPALDSIKKMRMGVAGGLLNPEQCAMAIIQGIDEFVRRKARVPAFQLWSEGNLPRLLDLMLPDASTSYKEQMIEVVFEMQRQQGGGGEQPPATT